MHTSPREYFITGLVLAACACLGVVAAESTPRGRRLMGASLTASAAPACAGDCNGSQ